MKKGRFCRRHARAALVEVEKAGFLQPLREMTINGPTKLAKKRFLTLGEKPR